MFGLGHLAVIQGRFEVVDFTSTTYFETLRLFVLKPRPVDPFLKAFEPIDTYGWIAYLVSAFITGCLTILILLKHPYCRSDTESERILKVKIFLLTFYQNCLMLICIFSFYKSFQ